MLHIREADIDVMSAAVAHALDGGLPPPIALPPDSADHELGQLAAYLNRLLDEYRLFADALFALSRGDLEREAPRSRLQVSGSLKHLRANLRHLTWKTQQVARGDFTQRVDFMGAFSQSFNHMVEMLAAMRDELMRRNEELDVASRTDPLTGLLNRRGMWDALERETHRSARTGRPFAIILADVDFFKRTNDEFGHDAGDAVLKDVGAVLKAHARAEDECARWGGEEFLVLVTNSDLAGGLAAADRFRAAVEASRTTVGGRAIGVTISAGVSAYGADMDIETCVKRADANLYEAKSSGRNCVSAGRLVSLAG